MKSSTRDKAEGLFHQAKGKIKETTGDLTDDPKMEIEGAGEKMAGKVQQNVGKTKKAWNH